MTGKGNRVPNWLLERVALGEVAEARVRDLLARDPSAKERLRELAEADAAFLAANPPERAVAEIERRARVMRAASSRQEAGGTRSRWAWVGAAAAAGVAVAVIVLLVVFPTGGAGVEVAVGDHADAAAGNGPEAIGLAPDESTRVKGGHPHLVVHRQRGERAELLVPGQRVAEGDRVQLSYVAATARHGVILSIDGRGVVTVHFPAEPGQTTALERTGTVHLAHSYQLDDAPDFERFFFVTSHAPIDVGAVRRAAETVAATPKRLLGATLPLGGGLEQSFFLLRKDAK